MNVNVYRSPPIASCPPWSKPRRSTTRVEALNGSRISQHLATKLRALDGWQWIYLHLVECFFVRRLGWVLSSVIWHVMHAGPRRPQPGGKMLMDAVEPQLFPNCDGNPLHQLPISCIGWVHRWAMAYIFLMKRASKHACVHAVHVHSYLRSSTVCLSRSATPRQE